MSMKRHNKQKKKQNRRIAAIVTASVLTVTLGTVGIFHQMQPIEAYAKESFTGTEAGRRGAYRGGQSVCDSGYCTELCHL